MPSNVNGPKGKTKKKYGSDGKHMHAESEHMEAQSDNT